MCNRSPTHSNKHSVEKPTWLYCNKIFEKFPSASFMINYKDDYLVKMLWQCTDCPQSEQYTPAHPNIFPSDWPFGFDWPFHVLEGFCSQVMVVEEFCGGQTLCYIRTETSLIHFGGGGSFHWVCEEQTWAGEPHWCWIWCTKQAHFRVQW